MKKSIIRYSYACLAQDGLCNHPKGSYVSNSGDFRVRKIGRSKLHSVLPMNENEFRVSEISYHLKKPSF